MTLYPDSNISKVGDTSWLLDALDPLFAKLSDSYMELLIKRFGTDHYYQAGTWVSRFNLTICSPKKQTIRIFNTDPECICVPLTSIAAAAVLVDVCEWEGEW